MLLNARFSNPIKLVPDSLDHFYSLDFCKRHYVKRGACRPLLPFRPALLIVQYSVLVRVSPTDAIVRAWP
jgi:hypothetical protein